MRGRGEINEGESERGNDFKHRKRHRVNNNSGKGGKGEKSQTWTKWKKCMGRLWYLMR